jgi:glycosyltransferase involved in cell wall biosynthesis
MKPLVSVIIPTFNGARHIRETLASVAAQTYPHLEIIVIDDGSTDATGSIVSEVAPHATLIHQPNLGHPAARNAGIRSSTGDFLSFLDHDDIWLPEKTASQLGCFEADPSLDLVFSHIQNFFSPELTAEDRSRILSPTTPLPGLLQGAMLARRTSFNRVGPFNEQRQMGDFLDWYGRATLLKLCTHMQPETVLMRRLHTHNTQRTQKHLRRQTLEALKELLDRRREAAAKS